MTRDEVEKVIPLAIGGIIEKCLWLAAGNEGETREKIFEIARKAEEVESRLLADIRKVKDHGDDSRNNVTVLKIKETLNEKSMEFHRILERFAGENSFAV